MAREAVGLNGHGEAARPAELRTRPIELDELGQLAQSPDPHHFLLKLYVPARFFSGSSRSFLLLPGIERRDTGWVELARHALSCSDAAVFVANETVWARASAQRELEDVRQVLKGTNPVFALTGADQSKDRNSELVETVMADLQLGEDERDRIVVTDPTPDADPSLDWRHQLRIALDRHAATTREARVLQLQHLEHVLQGEVLEILAAVDQAAARRVVKLDAREYESVRNVTDLLEEEIEALREDYANALSQELASYSGKARLALEEAIQREGGWKKFKELFRGKGLKSRAALRALVQRAWEQPEGRDGDSLALLHGRVLNDVVGPRLPRHNALVTNGSTSRRTLLGGFANAEGQAGDDPFGDRRRTRYQLNEDVLHDLAILLDHDAHGEVSDNFRNSVAVLPALALEAVRVGTLAPGLFDLKEKAFASADQIRKVGEEFGTLKESHSGILKGVGGMLGLDYVVDGDFDLIQGMAMKGGASAAAAGPIAFAVVGAVAIGYTALSVGAAVNRADLDKDERGAAAIDEVADRTRERFLSEFDRVTGLLVEHVRNRLVGYHHLDRDYARVARLHKAYADAREARLKLQDRVRPLLLA